jgi:superfamily II DNA or RNA helicase
MFGLILRGLRHHGALPPRTVLVTSRTQLVEDLERVVFQHLDPGAGKVWNTPKMRATMNASEWVGRYDGHRKQVGRVVVTTYPSLPAAMAEYGCDLLLCDEAHRSAAEKAEAAILSVPWRLGMSGTLYLTNESRWLKAFEEVLYRYTAADARADGVIVPVEIIDAPAPPEAPPVQAPALPPP